LAEMSRFREQGGALKVEYRMVSRSGREAWVAHEAACVLDDAGRPRFIQGVLFDVTNRKAAERGAREAEAMFRRLFDRTQEAVMLAAPPDGRILEANQAASRMFDASVTDIATRTLVDLAGKDRARLLAHLGRAVERGEAGPDEFQGTVSISLTSSVIDLGGERALLCVARRIA
ncbi:MAG TPA: PAS domain-containing protein, partial [Planctomycetota bacterium]|nr:PAS domain-containing protein [Planctomycetota bacterium]